MNLHPRTIKKIIGVLQDASYTAANVEEFFFDKGDGPQEDLESSSDACDAMIERLQTLLKRPTPKKKCAPRVVVCVDGGVVQSVLSNQPNVRCTVVDEDNLKETFSRAWRAAHFDRVTRNTPHVIG
jgi:hypothetical protein